MFPWCCMQLDVCVALAFPARPAAGWVGHPPWRPRNCSCAATIHTLLPLPSPPCCHADWVCPCCRDLCNCSTHRKKKKWEATGQLHRSVKARGECGQGDATCVCCQRRKESGMKAELCRHLLQLHSLI